MEGILKKIAEKIFVYWHRPIVALLVAIVLTIILFWLFGNFDISSISLQEIVVIVLVLLTFFFLRQYFTRLPKTKKGKFGFAIALVPEAHDANKSIDELINDLARAFRDSLGETMSLLDVQFLVIPRWHSSKIVDSDTARKYMRKCRANYLVFGDVRERKRDGVEKKILQIRQVVMHPPISVTSSRTVGQEVASIFPRTINFDADADLTGIEMTGLWLGYAAKYFVSMIALLSNELELAERTFLELHRSPDLVKLKKNPGIAKMRTLLPTRLSEICLIRAHQSHQRWRSTRDNRFLQEVERAFEDRTKYVAKDEPYFLTKSIIAFVVQDNVNDALGFIAKIKPSVNSLWRFNKAFLLAYKGELEASWRLYHKAFSRPYDFNMLFEIEEFLTWVLEREPERYQLLLLRALINSSGKGDYFVAATDLQSFLDSDKSPGNVKFRHMHHRVQTLLGQCREEIKSN